jgi:hypothetical protein
MSEAETIVFLRLKIPTPGPGSESDFEKV